MKIRHVERAVNPVEIIFNSIADKVFNNELKVRKEMIQTFAFHLANICQPGTTKFENLSGNLESVTKMAYIFRPMQWRWEAEKQVRITVLNDPAKKTCDIRVEGRKSEYWKVRREFKAFLSWLKGCVVLRHPNASK